MHGGNIWCTTCTVFFFAWAFYDPCACTCVKFVNAMALFYQVSCGLVPNKFSFLTLEQFGLTFAMFFGMSKCICSIWCMVVYSLKFYFSVFFYIHVQSCKLYLTSFWKLQKSLDLSLHCNKTHVVSMWHIIFYQHSI